jgi:hypothetical protein
VEATFLLNLCPLHCSHCWFITAMSTVHDPAGSSLGAGLVHVQFPAKAPGPAEAEAIQHQAGCVPSVLQPVVLGRESGSGSEAGLQL